MPVMAVHIEWKWYALVYASDNFCVRRFLETFDVKTNVVKNKFLVFQAINFYFSSIYF